MDYCNWPKISGENDVLRCRGSSTSGWVNDSASITTSGGVCTVTKTASPPTGGWVKRTITGFPTGKDWLLFGKTSAPWTQTNDCQSVQVINSTNSAKVIAIWFHLDQTTGTKTQGGVSIVGYEGTTKRAAVTSTGYAGTELEWCLRFDIKYNYLWCYYREGGLWRLKARVVCDNIANAELRVAIGGTSATGTTIAFTDLMVARPNIIVLGDSAANGWPLFSAKPSDNLNNYDSTWYRYAAMYDYLWNCVIVPKGVNGNTSADLLARLTADGLDHKPRVLIVQGPGNDRSAGISHADRTSNIQSIIDKVTTTGCHVAETNVNYCQEGNPNQPGVRDYYRDWWNNYSTTLTGLSYRIDTMVPIRVDDVDEWLDPAFATSATDDHLNPSGYEAIADQLIAA